MRDAFQLEIILSILILVFVDIYLKELKWSISLWIVMELRVTGMITSWFFENADEVKVIFYLTMRWWVDLCDVSSFETLMSRRICILTLWFMNAIKTSRRLWKIGEYWWLNFDSNLDLDKLLGNVENKYVESISCNVLDWMKWLELHFLVLCPSCFFYCL